MEHLLLISINSDKIITAFSWMLIHSLWQGLLLAVIAGTVLMLTKRSVAVYRYNLMLTLFIAFIGVCIYTFIVEWNIASKTISSTTAGNTGDIVPALFSGNIYNIKLLIKTFSNYFSANAPMIALIWFIVFLFKSIKMIACLVYNNRIRNFQIYEPDKFWADAVESFSKRLNIKKAVVLFQSGYIKMPVVVGHLKPVILIPVGLMAALPAEQVEAILLHELAHIRRNDYFVNFLQNIAETIFFFNPGLLWISTLLREERENCCDDIALEQTQNKVGFVQALISFKEHELYGSKYATAFPGKKNYLFRRISRILNNKSMTFGFGEKVFLMVSVISLAFVFGTVALGEVKEKVRRTPKKTYNKSAQDSIVTDSILANKDALKAVHSSKHRRIPATLKMQNGIAGISEKERIVAAITEKKEPIEPMMIRDKRMLEVSKDKKVAIKQQYQVVLSKQDAKTQQEQATTDQQATADQVQALKDQAQAKLDEQRAIKDQQQAIKDQAAAVLNKKQAVRARDAKSEKAKRTESKPESNENNEQAARNKEQVRLNEIQARKNAEQDMRNKEQERLNQIQAVKNEEQARRNEVQARLNKAQEKKNEEEAMKNKASIQGIN